MSKDANDFIRRAVRDKRERVTSITTIDDAPHTSPLFDQQLRERATSRRFTEVEREGTTAQQRASDHMNAAIRGELPRSPRDEADEASRPDFGGGDRGPASPPDPLREQTEAFNDVIRGAIYDKRDRAYRPAVRRR